MSGRRIRWFSDGAASACATMFDIQAHGIDAGPVVTCSTGSEDDDNHRFRADCEPWFGCPVTVIKSDEYEDTWDVWEKRSYMSGFNGAPCTSNLKVVPRLNFELPSDIHVFGYTADKLDIARAKKLRENYPALNVVTPLIDRGVTKANCLALLQGAKIEPPRTYAMGFPNANCLKSGCCKATSPAYWALHRKHFPEGFAQTADQARKLGVKLAIVGRKKDANGKWQNIRGFIDDIPLDQSTLNPIAPRCDLLCSFQMDDLTPAHPRHVPDGLANPTQEQA